MGFESIVGVNSHLSNNDEKEILKTQSKELEAILELAGNGISLIDKDGRFLYCNNSFKKMSGYTMEELKKESCISLSTPEYREPSREAINYAIRHGVIQNFKKVCTTKRGEQIHAHMSLSYIKERELLVMVSADISNDVAYTQKLEKEVAKKVEEFKKQNEIIQQRSKMAALGEMISAIAHQWRQPLNTIGLINQTLLHHLRLKTYTEETLHEIQKAIMEKVNFLSQTVDDFYHFYAPSKERELFGVRDTIREVATLIKPQLDDDSITLFIDGTTNGKASVCGFKNEFKQVILNLIMNSHKILVQRNIHNAEINIKISSDGKVVSIEIWDNGGGIREDLEEIFKQYVSGDGGTGIGLYMSKIIIEEHLGGKIKAKNFESGAMFTITLEDHNE